MGKRLVQAASFVALTIFLSGNAQAEKLGRFSLNRISPLQPTLPKASLFRHTSYPVAWTAAQKSNRPMLLFVTMPGCPYCVKMINNTYKNREVRTLVSESFESVYVDRYAQAKLVAKLKIKLYPTTILVSTNNQVLDVIEGYVGSQTFRHRLKTDLATLHSSTQKR